LVSPGLARWCSFDVGGACEDFSLPRKQKKKKVMAPRSASSAGGAGGAIGVGALRKGKGDSNQRKLVEEKDGGKKVSFRLSGDELNDSASERKELKELMEQTDKELKAIKEERKVMRNYIEEFRVKEKIWKERLERMEERLEALERDGGRATEAEVDESDNRSVYSVASRASGVSGFSRASSGLSGREVDKLKRWMTEKDREERRCNIVIRGIEAAKDMEKDKNRGCIWVQELIKDKIGVVCEVIDCRVSGRVIVAKVSNAEQK
jgi:hypothetical protein